MRSNVPGRPTGHCHKLIAEVAKGLAGELYEILMGDNEMWGKWKAQNPGVSPKELERRFVARNWSRCIESARATLAAMLSQPIDAKAKEEIHLALILDNTLIRGRNRTLEIPSNG